MNQLPENSLRTYDLTIVTSYLIGLRYRKSRLAQLQRCWLSIAVFNLPPF